MNKYSCVVCAICCTTLHATFFYSYATQFICDKVSVHYYDHFYCSEYDSIFLNETMCLKDEMPIIPKKVFMVSKTIQPSITFQHMKNLNTNYASKYFSDKAARLYISQNCGKLYQKVYDCFNAPAYRADLFRFCALWFEGGIYLDADLHLMDYIHKLYNPCKNVSLGHDWGNNAQMKIVAAVPRHPLMKCMLKGIYKHVVHRFVGNALEISGPILLQKCIKKIGNLDIAYTYIDTRNAAWPYTGLRSHSKLFAFEEPNINRHWLHNDKFNYANMEVYDKSCELKQIQNTMDL